MADWSDWIVPTAPVEYPRTLFARSVSRNGGAGQEESEEAAAPDWAAQAQAHAALMAGTNLVGPETPLPNTGPASQQGLQQVGDESAIQWSAGNSWFKTSDVPLMYNMIVGLSQSILEARPAPDLPAQVFWYPTTVPGLDELVEDVDFGPHPSIVDEFGDPIYLEFEAGAPAVTGWTDLDLRISQGSFSSRLTRVDQIGFLDLPSIPIDLITFWPSELGTTLATFTASASAEKTVTVPLASLGALDVATLAIRSTLFDGSWPAANVVGVTDTIRFGDGASPLVQLPRVRYWQLNREPAPSFPTYLAYANTGPITREFI